MRFLSAVLFVALTGSVALADDAKPADAQQEAPAKAPKQKVPLRVVRMLPETRQVLLFDKTKGTHVVAEVGQDVNGYLVDDIDDDEVTLVAPSGAQVILTAPWHKKAKPKAEPAPQDPYADAAAPTTDAAGPADPYADAATPTTAPIVAGDSGARVVSAAGAADAAAPSDPYGDPAVNAFFDAVNSSKPATAPATATSKTSKATKPTTTSSADGAALGAVLTGSPAPVSTPSATSSATTSPTGATPASPSATASATSTAGPTTATIKRADIDAALGDFAGTAATFQAAFTPAGLRFDGIADGSLLAKVGLQKGDVLTTIDGQPLRSLDDAANLYARLPTAHGSTLQVQRAGKPITLRIAIQ